MLLQFMAKLLVSAVRTEDPSEAHLFYIPSFTYSYSGKNLRAAGRAGRPQPSTAGRKHVSSNSNSRCLNARTALRAARWAVCRQLGLWNRAR
jgi:hypothetical protein